MVLVVALALFGLGPPLSPSPLPKYPLSVLSSASPWRLPSVPPERPGLGQQVFRQVLCLGESRRWSSPPLRSLSRTVVTWFRNASGSPPGFYRTFSDFKAATGPLRPGTVCHGWPTEGEARVYAWAAGQTFPEA